MASFEFYNPTKIIFGNDTIPQIGTSLKSYQIGKVLLLAGSGSIRKNGVYATISESLQAAGIQWVEHWGVQPNPVLSTVNEAIRKAKEAQVDAILAVGGGSVIDSAKAVAAGCCMEDVWDAFARKAFIQKALPLFVVLTLSATGSEMNPFTVITKEDEQKKWATASPVLYPTVSIIDPSVQMSLPWNQTVNGGLDAMAHILEFYVLGTDEEATLALDEALMRTVLQAVDQLQENPGNYAARSNLAWSATLALNGISGTQLRGGDWSTHMIEHGLSALHPEVAHGTGLGILFPAWIRYMEPHNPAQFQRWARQVWGADSLNEALEKLKSRWIQWGTPTSLRELGVREEELSAIADNVWLAAPLGQLKPLTRQDIEEILKLAF
jgi:alcohol dehydrogenase